MFNSATLKLTLWYVLFITLLSIVFSAGLYYFANQELNEALNSESHLIEPNDHDADDLNHIDKEEYKASSNQFLAELLYFDLLVIFASSLLSYIFARRTLLPIERAHQAQIRFTAEASHELRTPLAAMKLDTEVTVLQRNPDKKSMLSTLRANLRDINRLEMLTEHLLDISRYDNKVENRAELLDLKVVIEEVLAQFRSLFKAKKLGVVKDLSLVKVKADERAIIQLLSIVIDNAVKYSNSGGKITLRLKAINKQAVITVEDVGQGIAEKDLPHLFERFYRSSSAIGVSNKTEVDGYGLGLSLAKEIVRSHRGSIRINNKLNGGAIVEIKLPK